MKAARKYERQPIDFNSSWGRVLNGSKKEPAGHFCVWNANVLTRSRGKFWFGDLDLTDDAEDLRRLAKEQGETVFVLKEYDARFQTEANPSFDRAVGEFDPDGTVRIFPNGRPA